MPTSRPAPAKVAEGCGDADSPLPSKVLKERERALEALIRGDVEEADEILEEVLPHRPGNVALQALDRAVKDTRAAIQSDASRVLAQVPVDELPAAPMEGTTEDVPPLAPRATLRIVSKTRRSPNWEAFIGRHQLPKPTYLAPIPEPLAHVPTQLRDLSLRHHRAFSDHDVYIYGEQLVVLANARGDVVRAVDLEALVKPYRHGVQWAEAAGDILYVSNHSRADSSYSGGFNGYINAIDLRTGKLRWRSRPLVSNTVGFTVMGDHIVTAYGMRDDPMRAYVLDRHTGRVVSELPLESEPILLGRKGDRIVVMGVRHEYTLALDGGKAERPALSAPPAKIGVVLAPSSITMPEPTSDERCSLRSALIHLDHRRWEPARRALGTVRSTFVQHPLVDMLRSTIDVLRKRDDIDLDAEPVRLEPAPADAANLARHPPLPSPGPPPALDDSKQMFVQLFNDTWRRDQGIEGKRINASMVRLDRTLAPPDPIAFPAELGGVSFLGGWERGDHQVLHYGRRYAVVIESESLKRIVDFEAWTELPKPGAADYLRPSLRWAEVADGVLYMILRSPMDLPGSKAGGGYLAAVDLDDGALIWRTAPDSVATDAVVLGGYILAGAHQGKFGPGELLVIERQTGKVARRVPTKLAPVALGTNGTQLFVGLQGDGRVYDLR